jgi:hypothetical protein
MSDNSMLYVIKDIEGMSSNRENDRKQAMKGLQNILKFIINCQRILMQIENGRKQGGGNCMIEIKSQIIGRIPDIAKLELYRVIGEGYKAMQDGRTNTIEEVREKIDKRRAERGRGSIYRAGKV